MNKLAVLYCGLTLSFMMGCQGRSGDQTQANSTAAKASADPVVDPAKQAEAKQPKSKKKRYDNTEASDRDVASGVVVEAVEKVKEKTNWVPLTGTDLGFSVDLPGVPEQSGGRGNTPYGPAVVTSFVFKDVALRLEYIVAAAEYEKENALAELSPQEALNGRCDSAMKRFEEVDEKYRGALRIDGFFGLQQRFSYQGGYEAGIPYPPSSTTQRLFFAGNRLIVIQVNAADVSYLAHGSEINAKITRFFRSLKIAGPADSTSAKRLPSEETAAKVIPAGRQRPEAGKSDIE
jgi:hypothetical protein